MSRNAPSAASVLLGLGILGFGLAPYPVSAMTLDVGCPWVPEAVNVSTHNLGYPDEAANYSVAVLPTAPAPGATVLIRGTYPQIRYFSFQIDDGVQLGNLTDQIADAMLISMQGYGPNANPADLPIAAIAAPSDQYQITIKFEAPPSDASQRQPNTLYAGASSTENVHNKQLVMRMYLPNPGADTFGDTPLPDLIYQTPGGPIDLNDTTDQAKCLMMTAAWNQIDWLWVPGTGLPNPVFTPVVGGAEVAGVYPNGDSNYLRAVASSKYAPMLVVRAMAPSFPPLPPMTSDNTDARYWSLCEDQLNTTKNVGCLVDRDMTLQSDGTFTAVISSDTGQPATANSANGYNWLNWGPTSDVFVVMRQILPRPDFAGNYQLAINAPNEPVSATLGLWAPDITYCDPTTFDANAAAGGAAVMAACKASYAAETAKIAADKAPRQKASALRTRPAVAEPLL